MSEQIEQPHPEQWKDSIAIPCTDINDAVKIEEARANFRAMNSEQPEPMRKYYLTPEQQRVVDVLSEYERAYISTSSKEGNYMVLNGDKTERVRSNTLTALVKKGYLGENGRNRLKLI